MTPAQDTELTLSTGKLLAIFFGMVVICGIFFSLGYAVGKNSTPAASATIMDSSQLSTVATSGGPKPAAGKAGEAKPCATGDASCSGVASPGPANAESSSPEVAVKDAKPANEDQPSKAAPELKTSDSSSGFMVQVAAVGKQEDAEALAAALRQKQYPVFVVTSQTTHLYHVQVGPFIDQKDAETMRAKLASDGYNAILKR